MNFKLFYKDIVVFVILNRLFEYVAFIRPSFQYWMGKIGDLYYNLLIPKEKTQPFVGAQQWKKSEYATGLI